MSIAIKAENISKAYQLGEFSTGTVSRDIERWWALLRGKEDPFLRLGETNDRSTKGTSNVVWSLKDINFDIRQGDAVGIIGRNGAGKSTLLKILSRVTTPTTGNIKVKGRIASLLEVGTGFHPELTGRENIYLNGAILGMRKHEIIKHFDAIVDFSGVERYIDTPVKRYSSGMYVRLAFAVAAHLESEILVVDEVLAVGDAEFQKKCLGKMGDVSINEGRTVLFVSHNMGAIKQLCQKGILLHNGQMVFSGLADATISRYLKNSTPNGAINNKSVAGTLKSFVEFIEINVNGVINQEGVFEPENKLIISLKWNCISAIKKLRISFNIYKEGLLLLTMHDLAFPAYTETGQYQSKVEIPPYLLRPGEYAIAIGGHDGDNISSGMEWLFMSDVFSFDIVEKWGIQNDFSSKGLFNVPFQGVRNSIG